MQNETFRNIVRTEKYTGYIKSKIKPKSLQPSYLSVRKSIFDELFGRKNINIEENMALNKKDNNSIKI